LTEVPQQIRRPCELMRLGEPGNERLAVRHDGAVFDLGT
jgi:hypothetical protein